jgi:hypothetical protein
MRPLPIPSSARSRRHAIRHRALFVIGTSDPEYDQAKLAEVEQATGGESIVIDGADHSLEIGGDVVLAIRAMQRMVEGIQQYLG